MNRHCRNSQCSIRGVVVVKNFLPVRDSSRRSHHPLAASLAALRTSTIAARGAVGHGETRAADVGCRHAEEFFQPGAAAFWTGRLFARVADQQFAALAALGTGIFVQGHRRASREIGSLYLSCGSAGCTPRRGRVKMRLAGSVLPPRWGSKPRIARGGRKSAVSIPRATSASGIGEFTEFFAREFSVVDLPRFRHALNAD